MTHRIGVVGPVHALVCLILWSGCRSTPAAPVVADATSGDAGHAAPQAAAPTDAGPAARAPDAGAGDAGTPAPAVAARPTVYDRILVKPAAALLANLPKDGAAAAFQKHLESALGVQVADIRRSAGSWYVVTLVPAQPPRAADAQRALVEKLKGNAGVAAVEPDNMLQLK